MEVLGVKESTLKRNIFPMAKIQGADYIPRCELVAYKMHDRLMGENLPSEEWRDLIRLYAKKYIITHVKENSEYIKGRANSLLAGTPQAQIDEIIDNYRQKLKSIRDRLFKRIEKASDTELQEMTCLMFGIRYITAREIIDRDEDYRSLAPMLASCNIGYTKKEQAKYNARDPVQYLWDSFHKHYRNGLNWQRKREKLIKERGSKCEVCGSYDNLHVHHKEGRFINDEECLEVLCKTCHTECHEREGRDFTNWR